jgi:hypothetical protein
MRWLRPISASAAILLAVLAQRGIVDGNVPARSLIQYAAAAVLFLAATFRHDEGVARGARGRLFDAPEDGPGIPRPLRIALVASAIATFLALGFFARGKDGKGWLFHAGALAIFAGAAFVVERRQARDRPKERTHPAVLLGLAAVILLSLAARAYHVDRQPFGVWFDEANSGIAGRQILNDPGFRPFFIKNLELPAHFSYLVAASFGIFGESVAAMRVVSAALGALGVLFAFLLFRRWLGDAFGLAAAAALAVLRYHITFSRFGIYYATPVTFELLVLWLLDRALERKRAVDFAWLGLGVGISQAFYFPLRFVVPITGLALAATALAALFRDGGRRELGARLSRGIRAFGPKTLLLAAGVLVATAPIFQFAFTHRADFFDRTSKISIFQHRDEPDLKKALVKQVKKHILMFNVRGDGNARHNLPGEPMLDPFLGAAAALGALWAVATLRRPASFLMVTTFATMLMGGILTLDFEAPQSLRSIGVVAPLLFFSIVPLAAVWRLADPGPGTARAAIGSVVGLGSAAFLVAAGRYNLAMYFGRQQESGACWLEHSTTETIVGNEMNRLAPDHRLVVSATYRDHPTVHFLTPDVKDVILWAPGQPLSLPVDSERPIALLFEPNKEAELRKLQRAYPGGVFRSFRPPMFGADTPPLVFEVELTPRELRALQGAEARFVGAGAAAPVLAQTPTAGAVLDFAKAPAGSHVAAAELRAVLDAPAFGSYRFAVMGPGKLFVDEFARGAEAVSLAKGAHALRLEVKDPPRSGETRVLWQHEGIPMDAIPSAALSRAFPTASGLLARYFRSAEPGGELAFEQIDPEVNFYFHILQLNRPYSIEWKGSLFAAEPGAYEIATVSVDESKLSIDGRLVVDNLGKGDRTAARVELGHGWHDLDLLFWDHTGSTRMYLYWKPPGAADFEIVPSRFLSPPRGRPPEAPSSEPEKLGKLESIPYGLERAGHVHGLFGGRRHK